MVKDGIRVAICFMLVVAVLAVSLSVFAVDEGDRIVSAEYLWAYYIYVFLDSIGIDVTYQGVIQYTNEVQDTIIDWVINYIADLIEADSQPSNYSIAQWIAPWQAGYDYWGNLQFNSTMLEDMQDFAEWLKAKLSLVNDSTVVINPVYSVNGVTLFELNKYYQIVNHDGTPNGEFFAVNTQAPSEGSTLGGAIGYFVIHTHYDTYEFYMVNDLPGYLTCKLVGLTYESVPETFGSFSVTFSTQNNNSWYWAFTPWANNKRPLGTYYESTNFQDATQFLNNFTISMEGDVKVVTAQIVFPVENPDYSSGDGMTIIDGVPQYGDITFSGVIENLPAIVSTGTVSNPGLDAFWGFIPVLAEQTKDAIVLTRGLIYELPEEVVVTFYAVMGGLILFGIIKLMREH